MENHVADLYGKCGAELQEGQDFCPKCGQKRGLAVNPKPDEKKVNIPVVFVSVFSVCIIAFVLMKNTSFSEPKITKPDLNQIFAECALESKWANVGSDGSYLSIDTNPYDLDGHSEYSAYLGVLEVNEKLGLPESLTEKMNRTSALDGRQTETYDDVTVSWKYHPDQGLEVTYELN